MQDNHETIKICGKTKGMITYNQGWHILWIIFKKSSPADKIGENWIKLDKSREKWIKLIKTIMKGHKGQVFQ